MADIFFNSEVKDLLYKKHIVFFGDSNTRAVYKDVVWLLNYNSIIPQISLKQKLEESFCGDKLGKHSELNRGRDYEEERTYETDDVRVDFYFITKCYAAALIDLMEDIHVGLKEAPDVLYINSTFWDVCRWGPNGVTLFKENVQKLARLFKSSLPLSTLVVWATALPVSHKVQSSLLIKQIDFLRHSLRFDVVEANQFARQVMVSHGFDVLDNHFHMRMQIHRRVKDGVHYQPSAIRLLSNLLLTHIALSWDFPLPNRAQTILLEKAKQLAAPDKSTPDTLPPATPVAIRVKQRRPSSPKPHQIIPAREYHVSRGGKKKNPKLHSNKPYERPKSNRARGRPKSNQSRPSSNRPSSWDVKRERPTDRPFDNCNRPRTGDWGRQNFNNYPHNPPVPVWQFQEPFYQDFGWNSEPINNRPVPDRFQPPYQRPGRYPRY